MLSLHLNCKQRKRNDRIEMKIFRFFILNCPVFGNTFIELEMQINLETWLETWLET